MHCAVVKYSGRRRMTMMRVCILIRQLDTGLFCAAIDRTQPPPHRTDADRSMVMIKSVGRSASLDGVERGGCTQTSFISAENID